MIRLVIMMSGWDTFGPKLIWSPTIGPELIGPSGQMVPNQFGPPGQMVPRIFRLSMGTGCGDPEKGGPNWLGTICPGGPNFLGPFVHGDRILWGPFVQGDQFYGDRLSRGTGSQRLEVRGSNGFETKCIAVFIQLLLTIYSLSYSST